jgi:hypothetical protein
MDTFHIHNDDQLIIRPTAFTVTTDDRPDSPRQGQVDYHMPLTADDASQLMSLLANRFPEAYAARTPGRSTLLLTTEDGIEVHGTLDAFSLHYPPAANTDWCEDDGDCINALFLPDEPSWDTLWAEVAAVRAGLADMFVEYPSGATDTTAERIRKADEVLAGFGDAIRNGARAADDIALGRIEDARAILRGDRS